MPETRIHAACVNHLPSTLIVGDAILPARFDGLDDGVVGFLVGQEVGFAAPTMVCVTFRHAERAVVFVSGVVAVESEPGFSRVLVNLPREIATAETRSVFRVPTMSVGLGVSISPRPTGKPTGVKDISTAGACILMPRPHPERNEMLSMRFELDSLHATVDAIVVRSEPDRIGVRFELPSPESLGQLVRECERRWLRARRRGSARV